MYGRSCSVRTVNVNQSVKTSSSNCCIPAPSLSCTVSVHLADWISHSDVTVETSRNDHTSQHWTTNTFLIYINLLSFFPSYHLYIKNQIKKYSTSNIRFSSYYRRFDTFQKFPGWLLTSSLLRCHQNQTCRGFLDS